MHYSNSTNRFTVYNNGNKNYDSRSNCNAVIKSETNDLIIASKNTIIPEGVEIISAGFPTGVKSIVFPKSVKQINTRFSSRMIKSIEVSWKDLSELKFSNIDRAFSSVYNSCKLIVPKDNKELYEKNEPWLNFTTIIEKVMIPGDVNSDGVVDESDIAEVANYIIGEPSTNFSWTAADVNGDDYVNVADIVEIANIIEKPK